MRDRADHHAGLPRQARPLAEPMLLTEGAVSLVLHRAPAQNPGRGLLPLGEVSAPAVIPAIADVQAGSLTYQPLAFHTRSAQSTPLPVENVADVPLDAWLNGAAAVAGCWPLPSAANPSAAPSRAAATRPPPASASPAPPWCWCACWKAACRSRDWNTKRCRWATCWRCRASCRSRCSKTWRWRCSASARQTCPPAWPALKNCGGCRSSWRGELRCTEEANEEQRLADTRARDDGDMEIGIGALAGLVEGDAGWIAPQG